MFDRLIAVAALVAVAGCGNLAAPAWVILAGVVMLTSLRGEACMAFAEKYGTALGRLEAGSLFAAAAGAKNALLCAVAFGLGRAVAMMA